MKSRHLRPALLYLSLNIKGYLVRGDDLSWKSYQKPSVSAGAYLQALGNANSAGKLKEGSEHETNRCISCEPTQEQCPFDPPCQQLIDKLYWKCDGVTLPRYHFVPVS